MTNIATGHPAPAAESINTPNLDPAAVTISGLVLAPSYGPGTPVPTSEIHALNNIDTEIPAPGTFPFTRGLFPEGYRTRLWTMRQFAGFGSADDTNNRFKYLLKQAGYLPGPDGVLTKPTNARSRRPRPEPHPSRTPSKTHPDQRSTQSPSLIHAPSTPGPPQMPRPAKRRQTR